MRRFILIFALIVSGVCRAQTYYVDTASTGTGDGTTQQITGPHAAWKSIYEITGLLPGDSVLFHRGDTWAQSLIITASGEPYNIILFAAYGAGNDPLIDVSANYNVPAIGLYGVDYVEIQSFRLKGNGGAAAVTIMQGGGKQGSGAMGDGYTITVRDVNVLSNYGAGEGNHDGFSLSAVYPSGSSQALFYNISASKCRHETEPGGSHQCFTTHEKCKAKVYTANFSDSVNWYACSQSGQVEFYNLTATTNRSGGIAIPTGTTSENYCLISDSNLTANGGAALFSVSRTASRDGPRIIVQDSYLNSANSSLCINHGNITLQRNIIDINDPGWRFEHEDGLLSLQDNIFYCNDTANWARIFNILSPGYADVSGNIFNIGSTEYSILGFKKIEEPIFDSQIKNNIFRNVSGCDSVIRIDNDAYAPNIANNVFYNTIPSGRAIDLGHNGDETAEQKLNFTNNIFYNVADVIDDTAGGTYNSAYNCYYASEVIDDVGSITDDPLFVDAAAGDFHLKSQGWRWDKENTIPRWEYWNYDEYITSRCIDAGNPGRSLANELLSVPPDPGNIWGQNLRINIGAYGGTAQASMPPYGWALLADSSSDGIVNLTDLACLAQSWLAQDQEQSQDLNRDGRINFIDFALLANEWLEKTLWFN
jgi:hypothetical protein